MFKYMVVLAMVLAVAIAAPQILLGAGLLDNEGAKQVGLPYANGWTDGPNNGVGPVVTYAAAPLATRQVIAAPQVYSAIPQVYAGQQVIAGQHLIAGGYGGLIL